MTDIWEVLFFVNFFSWLVISFLHTIIMRRTIRHYQAMNTRWLEVVTEQREAILALREQFREQSPDSPDSPQDGWILRPWRE